MRTWRRSVSAARSPASAKTNGSAALLQAEQLDFAADPDESTPPQHREAPAAQPQAPRNQHERMFHVKHSRWKGSARNSLGANTRESISEHTRHKRGSKPQPDPPACVSIANECFT